MNDLDDVEARMNARDLLRQAYFFDVDGLARQMVARVKRGEFDKTFYWFGETLANGLRSHPCVRKPELALETIMCSNNRNAIEADFLKGWSEETDGPWAGFSIPFDSDTGIPCDITLPAWRAIAYHAFAGDVDDRSYELLGDSPEEYIAARLGIELK
jgi:hypothetical protein